MELLLKYLDLKFIIMLSNLVKIIKKWWKKKILEYKDKTKILNVCLIISIVVLIDWAILTITNITKTENLSKTENKLVITSNKMVITLKHNMKCLMDLK